MTKPWQTSSWRKKRAKFIQNKSCEWCGSTEKLTIDHNENFYQNFERGKLAYQFMIQYFENGKHPQEREEIERKILETTTLYYFSACPKCGKSVKPRQTMKPEYRCYRCQIEFDIPIKKLKICSHNYYHKKCFSEFRSIHYEEITAKFNALVERKNKEYLDFKDVRILCKRCAYARLKGMHLCPTCKKHYAQLGYQQCFPCYSKTKEYKKRIERRKKLEMEDE